MKARKQQVGSLQGWERVQLVPDYREQLRQLAQEYFESFCPRVKPLFPWVLVYVLPREQKTDGGLWLPDLDGQKKQHKATLEGIVLRVWGTWHEHRYCEQGSTVTSILKTQLVAGDVVVFPHWAGWPPDPEHSRDFRMVKEYETETSKQFPGGDTIFGIMEHDAKSSYQQIEEAVAPVLREWQMLAVKP
jgi:co-chaperonin GroES (HSP10)